MFKQKKLPRLARFGLGVASFLLGLILFVSILATTLIIDIRVATSENTIKEVVHALLSSPDQIRVKAPVTSGQGGVRVAPRPGRTYQLPRREDPDDVAADLTQQLIDMLYEELGNQIGEEMPVSLEEFTSLINESTAKDYIANKTAALVTDYFNDEITTTFEPEEIMTLINENRTLIESVVGEPLPDDIAQQVATVFDENSIVQKVEAEGLKGFMEMVNAAEGEEGSSGETSFLDIVDTVVSIMRTASSTTNLLLGIGISLVLMAAIFFINIRQIGKGLRRIGYSFLFVGLPGLALCLLVLYFPAKGDLAMLLPVVQKFFSSFIPVYAVTLGIGVLFVAAGIVLPIVLRVKGLIPVHVPVTEETEALVQALVEEAPVEITEAPAEETAEELPVEEEPVAEEAVEEEPVAEEAVEEEPAPVVE